MIHNHFTYAISLMYALEITDAMSFASYNMIKVDAFYARLNTMTYPLQLNKCILLEVGQVYTHTG